MKKKLLTVLIALSSLMFIFNSCEETVTVKKKARIIKVGDKWTDGTTKITYVLLGDYSYEGVNTYVPSVDEPKLNDTITVSVQVPKSKL